MHIERLSATLIMQTDQQEKWTEIEHLPEWDEEFYHVYTAKKHGKWKMLKTIKPEYRGIEEYEKMIEKEFDIRYNLTHPILLSLLILKMFLELAAALLPMTFMANRFAN